MRLSTVTTRFKVQFEENYLKETGIDMTRSFALSNIKLLFKILETHHKIVFIGLINERCVWNTQ